MQKVTFSNPTPLGKSIALQPRSLASLRALTLLVVATLSFADLSWAEWGLTCECPIQLRKLEPCQKPTCPASETYSSDTECVRWAKTVKGKRVSICEATANIPVHVSCSPIIENSTVVSCTMSGDPVILKKCEIQDDKCALVDVLVVGACKKKPGRDGWTISRGCTEEFLPDDESSQFENSQGEVCPGQCSAEKVTWRSGCVTPVEGAEVKRAACESKRTFRSGPPLPFSPPPGQGLPRAGPPA